MDNIAIAAVRACVREAKVALGADTLPQLARMLIAIDAAEHPEDPLPENAVIAYVKNQTVGKPMARLSRAALRLLTISADDVLKFYKRKKDQTSYHYINSLLRRQGIASDDDQDLATNSILRMADIVFDNWQRPIARGNDILLSGIYQLYRRYLPPAGNGAPSASTSIVCELVLVDSEAMECMLVTCERNVLWGTLYFNHQQILYAIVQRPSEVVHGSVNQRFFAIHLGIRRERARELYSGICIKTGDESGLPLGCGCLFSVVTRALNKELSDELGELAAKRGERVLVPDNSIILQYISKHPNETGYDQSEFAEIEDIVPSSVRVVNERTLRARSKGTYRKAPPADPGWSI